MTMHRRNIDAVKAEVQRLLERIDVLERCAGWTRYTDYVNAATSKPHPDDTFNSGQYTAAVKRASLDLSKALVEIRR